MSWVSRQHRTMAKWVSSKVGEPVEDLSKDLNDGIVLSKLVNVIAEECGHTEYLHLPLHEKPFLQLHKVENIDDVLKYCKLVLNINTSFVSAENVIEGDLKLILGLIWTFFVYATLTLILLASESNSILEIKQILLRWVNQIGRSKALDEVTNFSKDWSLQTGLRPDLIFGAICEFYLPSALLNYNDLNGQKRLANLELIFGVAEEKLQIPQLLASDDFNVLVPDEKCIILYILQWYTLFELTPDVPDSPAIPQEELKPTNTMSGFVLLCLEAHAAKRSYEAKATRLIELANSNIMKLGNLNEEVVSTIIPANLASLLNQFCMDVKSDGIDTQLKSRTQFSLILMYLQFLIDLLTAYEHFTYQQKPTYMHHDFPELQALLKSISIPLSQTGISPYLPEKDVALSTIATRLESLNELDSIVGERMLEVLSEIRASKLNNTEKVIAALEKHLKSHSRDPISPSVKKYVDELSEIMELKHQLDRFHSVLEPKHSAQGLRILLESLETIDVPDTPDTPLTEQTQAFSKFKETVLRQHNQQNLTHADLTKFVNDLVDEEVSKSSRKEFIALVPSRRTLNRSESDEFSIYGLDENTSVNEIKELALFDRVQQTVEQKLAGTYDKLYSLSELVDLLENGFAV